MSLDDLDAYIEEESEMRQAEDDRFSDFDDDRATPSPTPETVPAADEQSDWDA